MKSSVKILVVLALALATYLAYGLMREQAAVRAAAALCDGLTPGLPVADLTLLLAREPAPDRVVKLADAWLAIYTGLPPFSRHVCRIELTSGQVKAARLDHVD